MENLIEESKTRLDGIDRGEVLDAALIGATQNLSDIAFSGISVGVATHRGLSDTAHLQKRAHGLVADETIRSRRARR